MQFDSCLFDIGIQVAGLAAFAFGAFFRLIPQRGVDTLADIVFPLAPRSP